MTTDAKRLIGQPVYVGGISDWAKKEVCKEIAVPIWDFVARLAAVEKFNIKSERSWVDYVRIILQDNIDNLPTNAFQEFTGLNTATLSFSASLPQNAILTGGVSAMKIQPAGSPANWRSTDYNDYTTPVVFVAQPDGTTSWLKDENVKLDITNPARTVTSTARLPLPVNQSALSVASASSAAAGLLGSPGLTPRGAHDLPGANQKPSDYP